MDELKLTLPNKKEYVVSARLAATSFASIAGFNVDQIEDIRLAVGEACNNAVLHSTSSSTIDIEMFLEADRFVVVINDHGIGFEYKGIEDINPLDYEGSGLGLFIIKSLMDEVYLDSVENKGTTIRMIKRK
ncbi:MAG: histidine kinase [Clostridiales bacterium]|nr:MAG: histidine kinase [Clostridiales bacterium]